jgi:hypothetical protein
LFNDFLLGFPLEFQQFLSFSLKWYTVFVWVFDADNLGGLVLVFGFWQGKAQRQASLYHTDDLVFGPWVVEW